MVDAILVISMIVVPILTLIGAFYTLVYFSSEIDKHTAYFPKGVIVFSLFLSATAVLMLPLDVANRATDSGLPMDDLWYTVYILIFILVVLVIPYASFYYEYVDDEDENAAVSALKNLVVIIVIVGGLIGVLFGTLGECEVPVQYHTGTLIPFNPSETICSDDKCSSREINLTIKVSFVIYMIAMTSFVGWFLLACCGGIGLFGLPISQINDFLSRPRPMKISDFTRHRKHLNDRATRLKTIGTKIQNEDTVRTAGKKRNRTEKREFNRFRQSVYLLEKDYNTLMVSYRLRGGNPLIYYGWLIDGSFGSIVSLCWWLHIIIFVLANAGSFINSVFISLDQAWQLLGTLFYAIFAFHLMRGVVNGVFHFGLNVPIVQIHPMKLHETMLNSFLFNCILVLLSSVSVVHFCTIAFSQYARLTTIDMLFGAQVKYLKGFRYLWLYYIYAFIVISMISCIWFLSKKTSRAVQNFNFEDKPQKSWFGRKKKSSESTT